MTPKDIAIIGAGPAGLASALYLCRAGHRVVIFERFETGGPIGSGLMLQPTGLSVLKDLGLGRNIEALGQRIDRLWGTDAKSGRTVLDVRYGSKAAMNDTALPSTGLRFSACCMRLSKRKK